MNKIATVAISALLGATMYAGQADASYITLNPSLSTPALSGDGAFSTNNATFSNSATVTFDNVGNFIETGFFRVAVFNDGITPLASGVGTNYNIYGTFTATGVQAGPLGQVNTLSFTLFGDPGADTTFVGQTITDVGVNDIVLGTGSLLGTGIATVVPPFSDPLQLTLSALTSFTPDALQVPFFVAPVPFNVSFEIAAIVGNLASSSTCGATLTNCTLTITDAGGGQLSFLQVPEPATLGMVGMGLLGLGAATRRRRNRA